MGAMWTPAAFFAPRCLPTSGASDDIPGSVPDQSPAKQPFLIIGHRGVGKNGVAWEPDSSAESGGARSRPILRENTIPSLSKAAECGADFVEFDVQVTKDGCPVLFHDNFIMTDDGLSRKINELLLEEFQAIGHQRDSQRAGKRIMRQIRAASENRGALVPWDVRDDAPLPTLVEVFQLVEPALGFNCEVKFTGEDSSDTSPAEIERMLDAILEVVAKHRGERKVFFSSFHPDAVVELRRRCDPLVYPVLFLTDGGGTVFKDERMNSVEAAIELCTAVGLHGIVCEVEALLGDSERVKRVKAAGLTLLTYGDKNNDLEVLALQQSYGVDGAIVDDVSSATKKFRGFSD